MYEVIGLERLDYTNKNNRRVTGYRVHFVYDPPKGAVNFEGKCCDSVYCNDDVFSGSGIAVGSPVMPVYDKWGRCNGFMESPLD